MDARRAASGSGSCPALEAGRACLALALRVLLSRQQVGRSRGGAQLGMPIAIEASYWLPATGWLACWSHADWQGGGAPPGPCSAAVSFQLHHGPAGWKGNTVVLLAAHSPQQPLFEPPLAHPHTHHPPARLHACTQGSRAGLLQATGAMPVATLLAAALRRQPLPIAPISIGYALAAAAVYHKPPGPAARGLAAAAPDDGHASCDDTAAAAGKQAAACSDQAGADCHHAAAPVSAPSQCSEGQQQQQQQLSGRPGSGGAGGCLAGAAGEVLRAHAGTCASSSGLLLGPAAAQPGTAAGGEEPDEDEGGACSSGSSPCRTAAPLLLPAVAAAVLPAAPPAAVPKLPAGPAALDVKDLLRLAAAGGAGQALLPGRRAAGGYQGRTRRRVVSVKVRRPVQVHHSSLRRQEPVRAWRLRASGPWPGAAGGRARADKGVCQAAC
jgi:hypothetical protein